MSTLVFTDGLETVPEESSNKTVVTFNENFQNKYNSGENYLLATECVTDDKYVVNSEDYEIMRSWLANHASHKGIDIGPLLQSQFIYLFATRFFTQFRTVRAIVEAESPSHISVRTRKRLPYEWLEIGSSKIYTPIFECLADKYDFSLDISETGMTEHIKSGLFNAAGSLALRSVEHVTESATRLRDKASNTDSDIIIFLNNTNNLGALIPVWQELNRRGVGVTIVYHVFGITNYDTAPLESLRDTGVTVQSFENYMNRSVYNISRVRNRDFRRRWQAIHHNERFHDQFELDGIPVWDALKERFKLHYQFHYQRLVKFIETGHRVINKTDPEAVVFKGVGPKSARTFATVAKNRGIPTIMVQHGKSNSIQRFEPLVDYVAAWGELSKEFLITRGYDPSQIRVCGSPKFDHLHNLEVNMEALQSDLNIEDDMDVVMLASQPINDNARRTIATAVCESLDSMSDVVLLIRPHPREDRSLLQDIADEYDVETAFAPDQDIHHLIEIADIVSGWQTTVLFEASLMNTPSIILNLIDEPIQNFWAQEGFTVVDSTADLSNVVQRALRDESYRNSILSSQPSMGMRYAHNEDGRATERIADLITSV